MIDTPQIVQTTEQHTAVIHLTIPRADIQKEMGPAIAELMQMVSSQGIGPAGPWLSHHLRMAPDVFDFEVAVPVLAPVTPTGRVTRGRLPATRAMRTTYAGGYEGLGNAWGDLQAWVAAEGHTAGTDLWEVYRVGPESSQNPADWRTDLYQPLR
ncbi:MAG: GyrI-like domain-containing protein [Acidobacteria bacterium]|nr:GyrI-like domain-containing protein [Acidobacteriota bacterium]